MKHKFTKYLVQRLIQFVVVIVTGMTLAFIIPRIGPADPVESAIQRASSQSNQAAYPEAVDQFRKALTEMYGLEGNLLQQYITFWGRLFRFDLGPSFSAWPTPVMALIMRAMPYTAGLLLSAAVIAWIIGNFLGGLAGYFEDRKWSHLLGFISMSITPIPYYIMAFVLLVIFTFAWPIFPSGGATSIGVHPEFSVKFLFNLLHHAFLPALSLVLIGTGGWFLGMRALVSNIVAEDYVVYAETAGVTGRKILSRYVIRNALLPQVTGLAMQLGLIFNGAIITEYVFSYPGVGYLYYKAIFMGDYSLTIGVALFSIVGVALTVLMIDLLYPLFDPRVRYQ
jgi:peptide/nickel transport system permease protein